MHEYVLYKQGHLRSYDDDASDSAKMVASFALPEKYDSRHNADIYLTFHPLRIQHWPRSYIRLLLLYKELVRIIVFPVVAAVMHSVSHHQYTSSLAVITFLSSIPLLSPPTIFRQAQHDNGIEKNHNRRRYPDKMAHVNKQLCT